MTILGPFPDRRIERREQFFGRFLGLVDRGYSDGGFGHKRDKRKAKAAKQARKVNRRKSAA